MFKPPLLGLVVHSFQKRPLLFHALLPFSNTKDPFATIDIRCDDAMNESFSKEANNAESWLPKPRGHPMTVF